MFFEVFHFNRLGKKIRKQELNLDSFKKVAPTGYALALQYTKTSRIIFLEIEEMFERLYLEPTESNKRAVRDRFYTYIKIDEKLPDSPKNRVRDKKGRPVRKYEEIIDYYAEYNISKLRFIDKENFYKVYEEAEKRGILYEWENSRKFYKEEDIF